MADECTKHCRVLILIVMEHALGVFVTQTKKCHGCKTVLILIVMEHALGVGDHFFHTGADDFVLILIVMEHALGAYASAQWRDGHNQS